MPTTEQEFSAFFDTVAPRLKEALFPLGGVDRTDDAIADAFEHAWRHWDRVRNMENGAGYLYRIAQRRLLRGPPQPVELPRADPERIPEVDPRLPQALARLTPNQRVAVFLVVGSDWRQVDVAELMGISVSSVRNHLSRGLDRLRKAMEITANV